MTRSGRVIAFIQRVAEGKLLGQPIRLDVFQQHFILVIYDNPHDREGHS